jgi:hypothetical protein
VAGVSRLTIPAVALLLTEIAAVAAPAQVRVVRRGDDRLAGIDAVDVVVRGLDSETQPCGLAKSALLDVAASALRSAGLRATVSVRDSSWFYSTIVGVASSASGGRCATALSTSLIAHVDGIPGTDRYAPERWGSLLVGEMPLVSELAVVHTTPSSHAAAVAAAVRKQISAIGERIRLANR